MMIEEQGISCSIRSGEFSGEIQII